MGNRVSLDSPPVRDYVVYSSLLALKTLSMSPLTGFRRFETKTGITPEDVKYFGGEKEVTLPLKINDKVERVRRAHQNDLENIPIFILVSGMYLLTNPEPNEMNMVMKAYTAIRFTHTLVYAFREVPQPTRIIVFITGHTLTVYLAIKVLKHFW